MTGEKTTGAAALTAASAGTALIDPTGVSAVTFLASGTATVCGSVYHGGRKGIELVRKRSSRNKVETSEENTIPAEDNNQETEHTAESAIQANGSPAANPTAAEIEFGRCIRKISSALLGLGISGTLSIVVPSALAGVLINGGELTYQCVKLRKVKKDSGSKKRELFAKNPAKVAQQIILGLTVKSATSILFLGSEVDTFLSHLGEVADAIGGSGSGSGATLGELSTAHQEFTQHPVINQTTQAAQFLPNTVSEGLGVPELAHNDITWWDDQSNETVAAVGAATGASEFILAGLVEIPLDKQAGKLMGENKTQCGSEEESPPLPRRSPASAAKITK